MDIRSFRITMAAALLAVFALHGTPAGAQQTSALAVTSSPAVASGPDSSIPAAALLQPAELVQMLHTSEKPLILQVGSHVLYAEAHIPGSEYVGAAGTDAGLQGLQQRVSGVKKDQLMVLYCGCCPWDRCPNIRPAYERLLALGFTRVRALYLADNFGKDWVGKGYPVAKGR